MNNKGFAITSVIYGLSILGMMIIFILMGTISSSRKNVTEEAKYVEKMLIRLNQASASYSSDGQIYTVPTGESGWYRFEAFGKAAYGLKGAYTTGIIYAEEGQQFEIQMSGPGTEIQFDGETIMRAQHARDSSYPGGTTKCYFGSPLGGTVKLDTSDFFKLGDGIHYDSYNGSDAVYFTDCATNPSYIKGYTGSGETGVKDHAFVDGLMLASASNSSTGKVVISFLADRNSELNYLKPKNNKLKNATNIRVTADSSLGDVQIYYSCSKAYSSANQTIPQQITKCSGNPCTISCDTINGRKVVDEISVLFDNTTCGDKNVINTTVEVKTGGSYKKVYESGESTGIPLSPTGIHISAYQPDSHAEEILHGNYYIIPINYDTRALSAAASKDQITNPLEVEYFTGETRQKWAIDLINTPGPSGITNFPNIPNESGRREYRIMDLARFKALNIYYDENRNRNTVATSETFNSVSRNEPQIWNILPLKDGTYAIKTVVPSFDQSSKTGFLYASSEDYEIRLRIGKAINPTVANDADTMPTVAERFYLYSVDLSK